MRVTALGFAVALIGGCVRFETFNCADDEHCVLNGLAGRCEASGYCSFPDPSCEGEFRYSEHAPASLAHQCVEVEGTTGGTLDCIDLDGDGAGVGSTCMALDCDDDNPRVSDECLYIGPGGDDAGPGTRDAPWRTFAHAVSMLAPGDSLVVLDGVYAFDDAGPLHPVCPDTAVSGTPSAPIFVRADNTRQAVIDRAGLGNGVGLEGCDYWRVRGLSIVGADATVDESGAWASGLEISGSSHIELRELFVHHANRYFNEHGIGIFGSTDVLLEDVEVHDFFRSGFSIYGSERVTCRRCYGHSQGALDLPACPERAECPDCTECPDCLGCPNSEPVGTTECPKCSAGSGTRGDNTFYVEHSDDVLCENCISEGSHRGFMLLGGTRDEARVGTGLRVVQSISMGDDLGFVVQANSDGIPPRGAVIEDSVVIGATQHGMRISDPDALTLRSLSILSPEEHGILVADGDATRCIDGQCSLEIDRVLVLDAGDDGLSIVTMPEVWSILWSNIFGSGDGDYSYPGVADDAPDDDEGSARSNQSVPASGIGLGADECRVYVPEDSSMHAASPDGRDIGANVVERLLDGQPSGQELWSETGFPCGADPLAPAQIPGQQCPDFAARVGVGGACPAPAPQE